MGHFRVLKVGSSLGSIVSPDWHIDTLSRLCGVVVFDRNHLRFCRDWCDLFAYNVECGVHVENVEVYILTHVAIPAEGTQGRQPTQMDKKHVPSFSSGGTYRSMSFKFFNIAMTQNHNNLHNLSPRFALTRGFSPTDDFMMYYSAGQSNHRFKLWTSSEWLKQKLVCPSNFGTAERNSPHSVSQ